MDLIKEIDTRELMYNTIPKGGTGAELGVARGSNSVQLLFRTEPSVLFLVDTWEENTDVAKGRNPNLWMGNYSESVQKIFENEIKQGKVVVHKQFSTSFLASLPDNFLDWVYIDTNHQYQCISREIDLSVKKVRQGGYIMGHDYFSNPQAWGASIIRAVNERIQNGDIVMEAITREVWPSYLTRVL